jgi:hypothetical protein
MTVGPQRARGKRGPNKVWGQWHGGSNYALGEREEFSSQAHARRVFQSRISGWDPMTSKRTPNVEDSEMHLYGSAEQESPFRGLKQTKRGIRTERY